VKKFFYSLIFFACFDAHACKCVDETPQQKFDNASHVLIVSLHKENNPLSTFNVIESLKGGKDSKFITLDTLKLTSCEAQFSKDLEYLVFAQEQDGTLITNRCNFIFLRKKDTLMSESNEKLLQSIKPGSF